MNASPTDAPPTTVADTMFDPIDEAIAAIARGEIVVVADDENRENEGDLIMSAVIEAATAD